MKRGFCFEGLQMSETKGIVKRIEYGDDCDVS